VEKTFVMIKPDALERGLHWTILEAIEEFCKVKPVVLAIDRLDKVDVVFLYGHQAHQNFFEDMVTYLTRGPVILAIFEGEDAIARVRAEVGHYNKNEGQIVDQRHPFRFTIRSQYADLGTPNYVNLVHASDTAEERDAAIATFIGFDDEPEYLNK